MNLRRFVGVGWGVVSGSALLLYGYATQRGTADSLHAVVAVALYVGGGLQVAAIVVPFIQTGIKASVRATYCVTVFVLRAAVLLTVGSARLDRTSELLGAGLALCWAAGIFIVRAMTELINHDHVVG